MPVISGITLTADSETAPENPGDGIRALMLVPSPGQ
jgi:hypothetical protein